MRSSVGLRKLPSLFGLRSRLSVVLTVRACASLQALERQDGVRHALAVADAAFAAHFDFEDASRSVLRRSTMVTSRNCKPCGLVGPQAGVGHEQHVVVQLLARPLPALLGRLLRPVGAWPCKASCIPPAKTTPGARFCRIPEMARTGRGGIAASRAGWLFSAPGGGHDFLMHACCAPAACPISLHRSACRSDGCGTPAPVPE